MPSLSASLSSRLLSAAPLVTATPSSPSPRPRRVAGPVVASALRPLSSSPLTASPPLRQLECNRRRSLVRRSLKSDNAAETDWRVKEMMDAVRTYFGVWSGKVSGRGTERS